MLYKLVTPPKQGEVVNYDEPGLAVRAGGEVFKYDKPGLVVRAGGDVLITTSPGSHWSNGKFQRNRSQNFTAFMQERLIVKIL